MKGIKLRLKYKGYKGQIEQISVYRLDSALAPKGVQLVHPMPLETEGGGRGQVIPLFPDPTVLAPIRYLKHLYGPMLYGWYLAGPVPGVMRLDGDRGILLTLAPELPFLPHLAIKYRVHSS